MIAHALAFLSSLAAAVLATPLAIEVAERLGLKGEDFHKPEPRPSIPKLGGLAIVLAATIGLLVEVIFFPYLVKPMLIHISTYILAFLIGLVDDFITLRGPTKAFLTIILVIPTVMGWLFLKDVVVLGRPLVPVLGSLRITIIYWVLLPLAIAGPANVVNMLDVMNGVMPGTMLLAFTSLAAASVMLGIDRGLALAVPWLGALAGYLVYNAYPASVFSGDCGSLAVGAAFASIAVLTRLEFMALIALLPHLLNGMLVIYSEGFKEHRRHKQRPIIVHHNGVLEANTSPEAPLSLTRMLLALSGRLYEKDVVTAYLLLEFVAASLAVISAYMVVLCR